LTSTLPHHHLITHSQTRVVVVLMMLMLLMLLMMMVVVVVLVVVLMMLIWTWCWPLLHERLWQQAQYLLHLSSRMAMNMKRAG
jgi:ABC-type bacteriocin/lantibiotic exporter with double-glycine peptidase domain